MVRAGFSIIVNTEILYFMQSVVMTKIMRASARAAEVTGKNWMRLIAMLCRKYWVGKAVHGRVHLCIRAEPTRQAVNPGTSGGPQIRGRPLCTIWLTHSVHGGGTTHRSTLRESHCNAVDHACFTAR